MALGPIIMSFSRYKAVSFTPAIVVDYLSVAAARELPVANPWNFMLAFTGWAWFGIFISLLVVTATFVLISVGNKTEEKSYLLRAFDVMMELLYCLVQEGRLGRCGCKTVGWGDAGARR